MTLEVGFFLGNIDYNLIDIYVILFDNRYKIIDKICSMKSTDEILYFLFIIFFYNYFNIMFLTHFNKVI